MPNRFCQIAVSLLAAGMCFACAAAFEDENGATVLVQEHLSESRQDVVYRRAATQAGAQPLHLDVYQSGAACTAPRPAVIMIHGGGFRIGHKGHGPWDEIANRLAEDGYVAITINYRLAGDRPVLSEEFEPVFAALLAGSDQPITPRRKRLGGVISSAIEDAAYALRWVEANAAEHCIDASKIGLWGSSAGSHIALHAAYLLDELEIEAPHPSVVISYWGRALVQDMIHAGDAPLMIVHGDQDEVVPYVAALELQDAAQASGLPYSLYTMVGAGHGFKAIPADTAFPNGQSMFDVTKQFLDAHLRAGDPDYRVVEIEPGQGG